MKETAPPLAELQARFQAHLLAGEQAIARSVNGDRKISALLRLGIYRNAYSLRLVEVLGTDYPALARWLGEAYFTELASAYVLAHPSQARSVRHFGDRLPAFLAARQDLSPALAELAAFERAQSDVFDARETPALSGAQLAALAPEIWGGMALRLRPASRVLSQRWDTLTRFSALMDAAPDATVPAVPLALPEPLTVLLWRSAELEVHWRSLEQDEAAALLALADGQVDFGGVCALLADQMRAEEAPLRAASLLKRWLADGLLLDLFADDGAE